jgi:group I intron endonuclease
MKIVYIYALVDSRDNQIRYIGKTTNVKRRLNRHITERFLHDSYKDRWVRKMLENGNNPQIEIIDEVIENEWVYWEKFYISYFKYIGCNLTNGTHGGDEPPSTKGRRHTEESKLKMSQAKKGKPIPWLNNGSKRTDEHRKNLSISCKNRQSPNKGKKFDEEYRKKLSDSSTTKKKVIQYSKTGEFIKKWDSISDAQKALHIRHISEVCRGLKNYKTTGGYIWRYE